MVAAAADPFVAEDVRELVQAAFDTSFSREAARLDALARALQQRLQDWSAKRAAADRALGEERAQLRSERENLARSRATCAQRSAAMERGLAALQLGKCTPAG